MVKAILRNDWTLPIFFTLILIGFNIQLNWTHFANYPQSIHAWAQADYYAMAQKFYWDTWNLFEPQSWVLNTLAPNIVGVIF